MKAQRETTLFVAFLASQLVGSYYSFTPSTTVSSSVRSSSSTSFGVRPPSRVDDTDTPTPPYEGDPIETIDANTILPDWKYDRSVHPVPDQPWRRGDTDGCEDDVRAEWRREAEAVIEDACAYVGAELHGVTWGMSQLIVSLSNVDNVEGVIDGPEIVVDRGEDYDEELGPDLFWNPPVSEEEFEEYVETHPRERVERIDDPTELANEPDTTSLSAVAKCVRESLEPHEERLRILERHELILTAPSGIPNILETQNEFDQHRGYHVKVLTRDPFKSNRTLKGKLVARTALDILINVGDGRIVTIPQNVVYQTLLDDDYLEDEDDDDESSFD